MTAHHIELTDPTPIHTKACCVLPMVQSKIDDKVGQMGSTGVSCLSNSEWAAPVLLINKKDGDERFCVDYRELNKKTKWDSYPMLDTNECLEGLGRARFRSKMDFCSGFWQIPLTLEASKITAFTTC